jgi:hypothetical protein
MPTSENKYLIKKEVKTNNAIIIKNASDLVFHAGLLPVEIINLSINNIEQNGSTVNAIPPVNCAYPSSFRKEPILLSQNAQNFLINHITFIKTLREYSSQNFPLFPHVLLNSRYILDNSRYKIQNLWRALKKHSMYGSYDRHREAGVLCFCWNKFSLGISIEKIIIEAHIFSRYASLNSTNKIVALGVSRDCNVYETDYKNAVDSSKTLLRYHKTRPNNLQNYLSEFEKNLLVLDKRDQEAVLEEANKKLTISGNKLILKGNTLSYEKISWYKVGLSSIKKKSKKRISPI